MIKMDPEMIEAIVGIGIILLLMKLLSIKGPPNRPEL
jgi:hypothetical protein